MVPQDIGNLQTDALHRPRRMTFVPTADFAPEHSPTVVEEQFAGRLLVGQRDEASQAKSGSERISVMPNSDECVITFRVVGGIFGVGRLATKLNELLNSDQIGSWHVGQWIDFRHNAIRIKFLTAADGDFATLTRVTEQHP
jgi:hypothetical protein